MILRYIRRRLAYLREQPEPARLRAATLLTAGTGGALVLLWLVVLLPLQIKLNTDRTSNEVSTAALTPSATPTSNTAVALPTPLPQRSGVAGTSTVSSPLQLPVIAEEGIQGTTASPSPTPSGSEPSLPVQVRP